MRQAPAQFAGCVSLLTDVHGCCHDSAKVGVRSRLRHGPAAVWVFAQLHSRTECRGILDDNPFLHYVLLLLLLDWPGY